MWMTRIYIFLVIIYNDARGGGVSIYIQNTIKHDVIGRGIGTEDIWIDKYLKKSTISEKSLISEETKKEEVKIVAVLLEHNIPFRVMHHLSDVISDSFHDSAIAKGFSCKRTKSAAVAFNVLGKSFEKTMLEDVKSGSGTFSIITDVSDVKMLAIAIKFYSEAYQAVKSKFLCTVDILGETALHLFDALTSALRGRNLNIEACIGFAADTTNVMCMYRICSWHNQCDVWGKFEYSD
nr:unnamed protein product [Callosobruchus analis]